MLFRRMFLPIALAATLGTLGTACATSPPTRHSGGGTHANGAQTTLTQQQLPDAGGSPSTGGGVPSQPGKPDSGKAPGAPIRIPYVVQAGNDIGSVKQSVN